LATLLDLAATEQLELFIARDAAVARARPWPKRTQAELSHKVGGSWESGVYHGGAFVNAPVVAFAGQLTAPNGFMRYEGPGWESDKVGYRLYLDQRNGIDVFGKLLPAMVLQDVGKDVYGSYHEPAPWGMDILKVGASLGFGGFGAWSQERAQPVGETDCTQCRIHANGSLVSQVLLDYGGWTSPAGKADLKALLTIAAGSYLTKATLMLEGASPTMVAGIPKHPEAIAIHGETSIADEAWTYVATYGQQSLSGNHLGLVIFVRGDSFDGFVEDAHNYLVQLKLEGGRTAYQFAALWESSTASAASLTTFSEWIDSTLQRLADEPRVRLSFPATP
jgi:hypothetical protein